MCSKCAICLWRGGTSCLPISVHRNYVCSSVLKVVSELFFVLGLLIPVLKIPFRICFDIQLDLHEPVGGCQPNLGLIPALYVCGFARMCACGRLPADRSVLEISRLVPWNRLSPGGLLGGFNSSPPPFFLWNIMSLQTQPEHLFFLKPAAVWGAS